MIQNNRANRLRRILEDLRKIQKKYPDLIHSWRFAVASVYALHHYYAAAERAPQRRGNESKYVAKTQALITALLENQPPDSDWERGLWFNSAIMRLDAFWERIFKLLLPVGVDCKGPTLYLLVQQSLKKPMTISYKESSFGKIRAKVNQLKHEPGGVSPDAREDPDLPLQALEDMLHVLRDEMARKKLRTFKSGRVLAGRRRA